MQESIPLSMLPAGAAGQIDQVVGCAEDVHRLEELGLRPGARVEMVQSGAPCIVRLIGHTLCFRADEITRVLVCPEPVE